MTLFTNSIEEDGTFSPKLPFRSAHTGSFCLGSQQKYFNKPTTFIMQLSITNSVFKGKILVGQNNYNSPNLPIFYPTNISPCKVYGWPITSPLLISLFFSISYIHYNIISLTGLKIDTAILFIT